MVLGLFLLGILNMVFYEYRVRKGTKDPGVFKFDGLKKFP